MYTVNTIVFITILKLNISSFLTSIRSKNHISPIDMILIIILKL